MTDPAKDHESTTFWERSGKHPVSNPGSLLVVILALAEVCALLAQSSFTVVSDAVQVYCGRHQNCCDQRPRPVTAAELRKATSTRSPSFYMKYTVVESRTLTLNFHLKVLQTYYYQSSLTQCESDLLWRWKYCRRS